MPLGAAHSGDDEHDADPVERLRQQLDHGKFQVEHHHQGDGGNANYGWQQQYSHGYHLAMSLAMSLRALIIRRINLG
jgi:outer membrane biogenesis lipoprotein LolB